MTDWLLMVVLGFLIVASVIDWKFKSLPSIMLTAMLFAVAVLNPANLWFGIMGLIMAVLLKEGSFFSGIADIKVMTILAFLTSSITVLFGLILLTACYGMAWKVFYKWRFKDGETIAFVPVFLFVFLTIYLLGGFS